MFPTRDRLFAELPRWLVNLPGSQVWAVAAAFGKELERLAYLMRVGWQCWLITNQPADMLHFSGELRKLPRYSLDTDQSYRNRLWQAWEFYRYLGINKSIVDLLTLLGYTEVAVICNKDLPADFDDGQLWFWNRFWVRLKGFEIESWDQPGKVWDIPEETWNVTFDEGRLAELRAIVKRCRSCYNLFVGFIFVQADGSEIILVLNDE